jgi:CHAT domain-containing protein
VQATLDTETTLLSYWTLEDKTLAFLVTAQEAAIVELPGVTAQSVLTLTENLYQWRNRDNPHPLPLRELYQAIVAPLADKLKTTHVAIIPHQSLHYVPFAALTDGEHYFGQQYLLTVLPSASVLPFLAQNAANVNSTINPTALIFGNPQTDLPALPAAEAEAGAVGALFQTTVYTGAAASEAQLRTSIQHANIVHLAAHGNYNIANPLYSAIALASSEEQDGLLETREIFGLPLQGNSLVVLSACETTVNDLAKENRVALSRGDELVSLTRAFFFAGTPTVISSLWSVDDAATEKLMVSFYTHWLQDGMSKAEALQAAQADVRADLRWASPFYWAGFVLNGHPGATR